MNSLNSIIVEGNLVKEPELHTTSKGTSLCHLSVAVNRWFKQENGMGKEVSFFDVETWGKLAESVSEMGSKGRGVRVVGRLKQERWIDVNGKNCSKVVIIAEHVESNLRPCLPVRLNTKRSRKRRMPWKKNRWRSTGSVKTATCHQQTTSFEAVCFIRRFTMHTEIHLIVPAKDPKDAVAQAADFLETEHFFDFYDIWEEGVGALQGKRAMLLEFQKDNDWRKLADGYYDTAEKWKANGDLKMAGLYYTKAGSLYSQRFGPDVAVFNIYAYDYTIPGEGDTPDAGDWYAVPVNFHY